MDKIYRKQKQKVQLIRDVKESTNMFIQIHALDDKYILY